MQYSVSLTLAGSYATLPVMADLAHYGDTVLIGSLSKDSPATKLQRISFVQGSEGQNYDELWLQDLIMKHPGLLPVAQMEPVFEDMVPVCRELPLKAGYVDNVFVTPNGDIAIVECKLCGIQRPGGRSSPRLWTMRVNSARSVIRPSNLLSSERNLLAKLPLWRNGHSFTWYPPTKK